MYSSHWISTLMVGAMAGLSASHLSAAVGQPLVTPVPQPTLRHRRSAGSSTQYPVTVSGCLSFEDPDEGAAPDCECSGWNGVLPFISSAGTQCCSYSVITSSITPPTTTNTFDTFASFPYTTTLPNKAVVAFASTTSVADAGPWQKWAGVGANTTIQAGMSMSVHADTTGVKVGTLTGGVLYTSVSNAIASACPSPSGTVTSCSDAAVTGLTYVDPLNDLKTDGKLDLKFHWVSYHDAAVLSAIISTIAQTMTNHTSSDTESYCWARSVAGIDNVNSCDDETPPGDWPTIPIFSSSNILRAIFSEQDEDTGGKVDSQLMEVEFSFQTPKNPLTCAAAAFALDAFAVLAPPALPLGQALVSLDCVLEKLGAASGG